MLDGLYLVVMCVFVGTTSIISFMVGYILYVMYAMFYNIKMLLLDIDKGYKLVGPCAIFKITWALLENEEPRDQTLDEYMRLGSRLFDELEWEP